MSSERLVVERLSAAWGGAAVLRSVSFAIEPGQFATLLGPNGAGKTTLLRCLTGLDRPTSGSIRLGEVDLTDRPTHRRRIGLVTQEPSLFPHRTVRENLAYGPFVQGWGRARTERRVAELLARFGLDRFAERYPAQLSGGEQARVALARTLAPAPSVILLDEPFAAVDPAARGPLRSEFRRQLADSGATVLLVTHDRDEALFLGERLLLLLDGRLARDGPPRDVFDHPRSPAVARFFGYSVIDGPAGPVAVRPEGFELASGPGAFAAVVEEVGPSTAGWTILLARPDGQRLELHRPRAEAPPAVGATVTVRGRTVEPLDLP